MDFSKLKDAIFTPEPEKIVSKAAPAKPSLKPVMPAPVTPIDATAINATTMQVDDTASVETFMGILKEKTDFEQTPVGQKVKKHLEPLEGVSLPEDQKMAIALKYLADDGITADGIISTLTDLQSKLVSEKAKFESTLEAARRETVEGPKATIEQLGKDIAGLQLQIETSKKRQNDLAGDMMTSDAKIRRTELNYSVAYEGRLSDLKSLADRYNNLLKGQK